MDKAKQIYPTVSIWHVQWNCPHENIEQVFGKLKLDLIGSFEGTRAIVCTKKDERSDQRRSNQRLRYPRFDTIHNYWSRFHTIHNYGLKFHTIHNYGLKFHTIHNYCNADLPRPFRWGVWARGRDRPRGWREWFWGDTRAIRLLFITGHLTICPYTRLISG